MATASLWGCDHGVSFHTDVKLRHRSLGLGRRVAARRRPRAARRALDALLGGLAADLEPHLTGAERNALTRRVQALLRADTMPNPHGRWPSIPWPAF